MEPGALLSPLAVRPTTSWNSSPLRAATRAGGGFPPFTPPKPARKLASAGQPLEALPEEYPLPARGLEEDSTVFIDDSCSLSGVSSDHANLNDQWRQQSGGPLVGSGGVGGVTAVEITRAQSLAAHTISMRNIAAEQRRLASREEARSQNSRSRSGSFDGGLAIAGSASTMNFPPALSRDDPTRGPGSPGGGPFEDSWNPPPAKGSTAGFQESSQSRQSSRIYFMAEDEEDKASSPELRRPRATSGGMGIVDDRFDRSELSPRAMSLVEQSLYSLLSTGRCKLLDLRLEIQAHVCAIVEPKILKPLLNLIVHERRFRCDYLSWAFCLPEPAPQWSSPADPASEDAPSGSEDCPLDEGTWSLDADLFEQEPQQHDHDAPAATACSGDEERSAAAEQEHEELQGSSGDPAGLKLLELLSKSDKYRGVLLLSTVRRVGMYPNSFFAEEGRGRVPAGALPHVASRAKELLEEIMQPHRESRKRAATTGTVAAPPEPSQEEGSPSYGYRPGGPPMLSRPSTSVEFSFGTLPELRVGARKRSKYARNHFLHDQQKQHEDQQLLQSMSCAEFAATGGFDSSSKKGQNSGTSSQYVNDDGSRPPGLDAADFYDPDAFLQQLLEAPDPEQMVLNQHVLEGFSAKEVEALRALRQPPTEVVKVIIVIGVLKNVKLCVDAARKELFCGASRPSPRGNNISSPHSRAMGDSSFGDINIPRCHTAAGGGFYGVHGSPSSGWGRKPGTALAGAAASRGFLSRSPSAPFFSDERWSPTGEGSRMLDGGPSTLFDDEYPGGVVPPFSRFPPGVAEDEESFNESDSKVLLDTVGSKFLTGESKFLDGGQSSFSLDGGTSTEFDSSVVLNDFSNERLRALSGETYLQSLKERTATSPEGSQIPKALKNLSSPSRGSTRSRQSPLRSRQGAIRSRQSPSRAAAAAALQAVTRHSPSRPDSSSSALSHASSAISGVSVSAVSAFLGPAAVSAFFGRSDLPPGSPPPRGGTTRSDLSKGRFPRAIVPPTVSFVALRDLVLTKTLRMELIFLHLGVISDKNFELAEGLAKTLDVETLRRMQPAAATLLDYAKKLLGADLSVDLMNRGGATSSGGAAGAFGASGINEFKHVTLSADPTVGLLSLTVEETFQIKRLQEVAVRARQERKRKLRELMPAFR